METIASAYRRFLAAPSRGTRYDARLFEAFLEEEGLSPHAWPEEELMTFFMSDLGFTRAEAREAVEQLCEWGPRAPPG